MELKIARPQTLIEYLPGLGHLPSVHTTRPQTQTRPSRLATGACLLAVLVTQQWLWLLGLFLFASADGSHRALLTQESSGLAIVLRHDAPGASPVRGHDRSFGHEHCLPAKLLTLLAEDRTSQTDHVIQFSAAVPHLTNPASASPMPSASFVFPPVLTSALPQYLPAHALPLLQPRPPPVASALLLQLRSTVLLI